MARSPLHSSPSSVYQTLALVLLLLALYSPSALAKSSLRPVSDNEIRVKKASCYADIESGMWGRKCRSSMTEKENCALRCLSPECYSLIYESDPLEEGEKDYIRGQEYKYCMHKLLFVLGGKPPIEMIGFTDMSNDNSLSLGESLDGVKGSFDY